MAHYDVEHRQINRGNKTNEQTSAFVTVTPRGRKSLDIPLDELKKHYHLPLLEVAFKFGVCGTVFKKICRRQNIARWPYRVVRSIDWTLRSLEYSAKNSDGMKRKKYLKRILELERKREWVIQHAHKGGDIFNDFHSDIAELSNDSSLKLSSQNFRIDNKADSNSNDVAYDRYTSETTNYENSNSCRNIDIDDYKTRQQPREIVSEENFVAVELDQMACSSSVFSQYKCIPSTKDVIPQYYSSPTTSNEEYYQYKYTSANSNEYQKEKENVFKNRILQFSYPSVSNIYEHERRTETMKQPFSYDQRQFENYNYLQKDFQRYDSHAIPEKLLLSSSFRNPSSTIIPREQKTSVPYSQTKRSRIGLSDILND